MKRKITARLVTLLLVILLLAGCGTAPVAITQAPATVMPTGQPAATPVATEFNPEKDVWGKEPIVIGIFLKTLAHQYYNQEKDGAVKAMADHNAKYGRNDQLVIYDHNRDLQREMANAEDAIISGIDVALVNPIDVVGSNGMIEALKKAGIKVINFDGQSKMVDICDAFIGSDNYEAGRLQMEKLLEMIGHKGNIIMFLDSTNTNSAIRAQGANDELKKWPDVKVLEVFDGPAKVEEGLDAMQNFIQAYASVGINGVWCFSDTMGQGVASAIAESTQAGKIKITSLDGNKIILDMIKQGKHNGTVAQFPFDLAYQCVNMGFGLMAGQKYPEKIFIDVEWIDLSNVDKYYDSRW